MPLQRSRLPQAQDLLAAYDRLRARLSAVQAAPSATFRTVMVADGIETVVFDGAEPPSAAANDQVRTFLNTHLNNRITATRNQLNAIDLNPDT